MPAFEAIASTTLSSSASSVTFSSIPDTYEHLQLRLFSRCDIATTAGGQIMRLRLNSDTGSNYAYHRLVGTGSSVAADGLGVSQTEMRFGFTNGSSALSNTFAVVLIDFVDYANTNKYKTVRSIGGAEDNTNGRASLYSGLWLSTSAISTIEISLAGGSGNFVSGTVASLYGLRSS